MHLLCHPFLTEKQSRKEIAADPSRYPVYPFIKTHSMDDWERSTTMSKALDTYGRHMAKAMYFVRHEIASTFEACRATISPAVPTNSKEYATLKKRRHEQQMYWQTTVVRSFCLKGVQATVEKVEQGQDWWASLCRSDRMEVWESLWDYNPLKVALAMYDCLCETINLRAIFSHDSDEALLWQAYVKYVFCQTCDSVYIDWVKSKAGGTVP